MRQTKQYTDCQAQRTELFRLKDKYQALLLEFNRMNDSTIGMPNDSTRPESRKIMSKSPSFSPAAYTPAVYTPPSATTTPAVQSSQSREDMYDVITKRPIPSGVCAELTIGLPDFNLKTLLESRTENAAKVLLIRQLGCSLFVSHITPHFPLLYGVNFYLPYVSDMNSREKSLQAYAELTKKALCDRPDILGFQPYFIETILFQVVWSVISAYIAGGFVVPVNLSNVSLVFHSEEHTQPVFLPYSYKALDGSECVIYSMFYVLITPDSADIPCLRTSGTFDPSDITPLRNVLMTFVQDLCTINKTIDKDLYCKNVLPAKMSEKSVMEALFQSFRNYPLDSSLCLSGHTGGSYAMQGVNNVHTVHRTLEERYFMPRKVGVYAWKPINIIFCTASSRLIAIPDGLQIWGAMDPIPTGLAEVYRNRRITVTATQTFNNNYLPQIIYPPEKGDDDTLILNVVGWKVAVVDGLDGWDDIKDADIVCARNRIDGLGYALQYHDLFTKVYEHGVSSIYSKPHRNSKLLHGTIPSGVAFTPSPVEPPHTPPRGVVPQRTFDVTTSDGRKITYTVFGGQHYPLAS
jgi:hypothetical protein